MMSALKVKASFSVLGLSVGLCAPAAFAAAPGPYVGVFGGFNKLQNERYELSGRPTDSPVSNGDTLIRIESDDGYVGGFTLGYRNRSFRPELEFAYRSNDVDRQTENRVVPGTLLTPETSGMFEANVSAEATEAYSVMGNLWYDFFAPESRLRPYIGGGLGAVRFKLKNPTYNEMAVGNDRDTRFAMQVGAGISFALTQHIDIGLDYRYLESTEAELNYAPVDAGQTPPASTGFVNAKYRSQSAMLGLRYNFGAPPPPPPPPEPVRVVEAVPPPPPLPPPPPCTGPESAEGLNLEGCKAGDTIVLRGVNFEFDRFALTVNARMLLDDVAEKLNQRTEIVVDLVGHTDSRGAEPYNQQLSERRAAAVKEYLVSKGVDASRMTPRGEGELNPIADNNTDEGRELNRRVELTIVADGS